MPPVSVTIHAVKLLPPAPALALAPALEPEFVLTGFEPQAAAARPTTASAATNLLCFTETSRREELRRCPADQARISRGDRASRRVLSHCAERNGSGWNPR
jgi:hypothetical protein